MAKHDLVLTEVVYTNADTGVRVSVGFLEPEHLSIAVKEMSFPSVRSCNIAIHEAMTHSSLRHPHIVTIYDCFLDQTAGGFFTANIVTERMETDLYMEIENRRRDNRLWDEEKILTWMRDLISALSCAEQHGISHRDIKPQNIFISGNDVKIGDFGASFRDFSTDKGRQKSLQGSPFFLSP